MKEGGGVCSPGTGQFGPGLSSMSSTFQPCFHLCGSCGGPPRSLHSGLPTVFFSLLSGNPPPKESHYWPAGAGVPWQVTQQKETGGREGGKRTGHPGGQLSPCYQMGASQLTAAPALWGIFCQGGKWGSLTFGKQVSPRTNIRSLPDTRRWREIWAGAFQMQGNECKAAGRGPAQEERAVGTVTRS